MRLLQLRLSAFGHFTNVDLNFEHPRGGFHLVYGSNEAGKSTALRAVQGLLYGIPQNSPDVFLHSSKELRLGGEIEGRDPSGELRRLSFWRRKGRKNTLLGDAAQDGAALDSAVLDELALAPFLGGADPALFSAMFGLNHEALRDGAEALLKGEGKLGESLFGASIGTGSVRAVLTEFREHAELLFTDKGRSAKRINQGIAEVRGLRQKVAQSLTSAQSYLAQEATQADLIRALDLGKGQRAALRAQKNALERQLRSLALLARRQALLEQIQALGALTELPADVRERRLAAVAQREEHQKEVDFERVEIARSEQALSRLPVSQGLVDLDEEVVLQLGHRLGQHRKARLDLPKRHGELKQLEDDARALLTSLGHPPDLAKVERLRLSKSDELKLRRLNDQQARFDATITERAAKLKEAQSHLAWRKKELQAAQPVPSTRALAQSVGRARQRLELAAKAGAARLAAETLEAQLTQGFAALEPLCQSLRHLADLPVPSVEAIRPFVEQFELIDGELHELRKRRASLREREIELAQQQQELEAGGELPSLPGLQALRAKRDALSEQLGEQLGEQSFEQRRPGQGASTVPATQLWHQLRELTTLGDEYSDRLRSEATRVAKLGVVLAEVNAARAKQLLVLDQEATSQAARAHAEQSWSELWQSRVAPLAPKAMLRWLTERDGLLLAWSRQQQAQREAREGEGELAEALAELSAELVAVGETARLLWESPLQTVERAEETARALTEKSARRQELERELRHAETQVEQLSTSLEEAKEAQRVWRAQWQKALKPLGLERDAGAEEVNAMLEGLGDLFHRLDQAQTIRRRIAGMDRDSEQLAEAVRALAQAVLPAALELDVEPAAETLLREHKRAAAQAAERARLQEELQTRSGAVERAALAVRQATESLNQLLFAGQVDSAAELELLEQKLEERNRLRSQVRELEDEILSMGQGLSLQQLAEEAAQTTGDQSRERIAEIEPELDALDKQIELWVSQKASADEALKRLGAGAMEAAEELALRNAALQEDVRRYLRLRLASEVLEQEVERYRQAHQGPVLDRAREMFPRLTLGRYSGLSVGFDKKDEPVLECVASDGRIVPIDGLSDGTRDQLYLSLRLSTLLHYLEQNTALPLVLDDILIHFDDDRACAALAVLGDVAEKTQVLFFTHHQRLVELAQKTLSPQILRQHELPRPQVV
ncbi:MAG: hypothetical protein RJA70_2494 [Pseudomonadota bacterium]|jgi:uncharacterized protein YhaN